MNITGKEYLELIDFNNRSKCELAHIIECLVEDNKALSDLIEKDFDLQDDFEFDADVFSIFINRATDEDIYKELQKKA